MLGDRTGARTPQQLTPSLSLLFSHWGWWSRGLSLLGCHVDHEVHHPVAVGKFIVIPGNELDKAVIEGNASPSIESGCWEFPGGPVVRTPRFHYRGPRFNPWLGN